MVFREGYGEHYNKIIYFGSYHPYRRYGERNPDFDGYSGMLLDLKESKESAIETFYRTLEPYIAPDVPVAMVPSHDPAKTTSGPRSVAERLAAADRIDATRCLVRRDKIDKLAHGGNRAEEVHLNSIVVRRAQLVVGRHVLLIDDIMTTGNSLRACKALLMKAGAAEVQMVALAKTA